MKTSTFAVGTLRATIAWCLVVSACGTAGRFLNGRQTPVAARWQPHEWRQISVGTNPSNQWQTLAAPKVAVPARIVAAPSGLQAPATKQLVRFGVRQQQTPAATPVQAAAEANVQMKINSLQQEADSAVKDVTSEIATKISTKTDAAKAVVEKEIPAAEAADTHDLQQDDAEAVAEVQKAMDASTKAAEASVDKLKEKTEAAVKTAAAKSVGDVVKEVEQGADFIISHSAESEVEAKALTKAGNFATKLSKKAANNSALWVKELPTEDAADSVKNSLKSLKLSADLRKSYEDVKRVAKLTGNLALDTIRKARLAIEDAAEAKEDATLTMEQAGQNALLLNTIRMQTADASALSLSVVDKETT